MILNEEEYQLEAAYMSEDCYVDEKGLHHMKEHNDAAYKRIKFAERMRRLKHEAKLKKKRRRNYLMKTLQMCELRARQIK